MKNKLEKWVQWIKIICTDVENLCYNRHVFLEVQSIIKANDAINVDNPFFDLLYNGFTSIGVMGVRRQVKIQNDGISLARLIKDIYENPQIISLHWYKSLHDDSMEEELIRSIFMDFKASDADHINPEMVKQDIEALKNSANSVEGFADRRLAHSDKRAVEPYPTFRDLHECITLIENLALKYRLILTGVSGNLTPIITEDWKTVFRVPWINIKT